MIEEYLARQYCEPGFYWFYVPGLGGGNHYTYNEINLPEYWLDAAVKYIQQKPSAAARQLHRRVEAARAEFKTKQDRIYGNHNVLDKRGLEKIYGREDKAWNTFNAQKRAYLKDYLRAIETGTIDRYRTRRRHRCEGEKCRELLSRRARFCNSCKKARNREAARVYRRARRHCSVISYPREISPKTKTFSYRDTPKTFYLYKDRLPFASHQPPETQF